MVKVSIKVSGRGACSRVAVRAESIRKALSIAQSLYLDADVRVVYPIDPEAFFVKDAAATAGPVALEMPRSAAG